MEFFCNFTDRFKVKEDEKAMVLTAFHESIVLCQDKKGEVSEPAPLF